MNRWPIRFAWVAIGLVAISCSSENAVDSSQGGERQHCYANGTCNAGLSCFSNFCVHFDSGLSTGANGTTGDLDAAVGNVVIDASDAGTPAVESSDAAHDNGFDRSSGESSDILDASERGAVGDAISDDITDASVAADATEHDASTPDAMTVDSAPPTDAQVGCPIADAAAISWPTPDGATSVGPGAVLAVASGNTGSCALSESGQIKCWGSNYYGQLGLGDVMNRGDDPNEMGDHLPFVSLGTGLRVRKVGASKGAGHVCALFDDGRVKCWGDNEVVQLGLGDGISRGDKPGQMGDNLPFVALGTNRKAIDISVGGFFTCALLENRQVKCWGTNRYGELGLGDLASRGGSPAEMGDNLPALDLGTCRTANAVSAALWGHVCAILDNGHVKCWGQNDAGQLGIGDYLDRGGKPGQMGDALPEVQLGTGRTAKALATGWSHTCALLDNGHVKCWGSNFNGELGLGDTMRRGISSTDMGDNLPDVDLGTGRTAIAVSCGAFHSCALLDTEQIKCWGQFYGLGEFMGYVSQRGNMPGQMGDALPTIDLGTGRTVKAISAGGTLTCALLDNGEIKCWGTNTYGELGQGDIVTRGNLYGQMGDALNAVPLW